MKYLYILLIISVFSCESSNKELTQIAKDSIKASITQVMNTQAKDWSNGDIDAFMNGYWNNEKLRFVGSKGITYGWEQTKANYKRGYPDKAAMGELKFDIKDIDVLSEDAALLLGGFTLHREKDTLSGNFTLTWKKFADQWLITSDMTCG